ncbi:MAG: flagellar basal body rod protein FlgC [Pseudomonadales bacterium]|nr:flagellar basal body rod protein FlgC [Pseudomonadales bacterium]
MSLLNVFDVSGSAMAAQSVRLNTTASNLANAQSVSKNPEDTYRARHPLFAEQLAGAFDGPLHGGRGPDAGGVAVLDIIESQAPLDFRYEPNHPYANEEGFVAYPNVSPVEEMANMISASRSFQLNVEVMNTARTLAERVLNLGQ